MRARRKRQGQTPAARTISAARSARREAALEARVAELEKEVRARDDFLAVAAHELRNPMTPISARLELLVAKTRQLAGRLPDGLLESIQRLEQLVDAYLRRATTLLDVSRINSGNLRLHTTNVDLSALMRQVAANMTPLAETAGCRVDLHVQRGVMVRCDAPAVEQIVENLLSNAIRYGPGQPIDITFASDGKAAQLSIHDHGIGMSPSDLDRLQGLPRPGPNGGLGVGLWMTRRLAQAMRGELSVASEPGAGSTFTVRWPLEQYSEDNAR